MQELNQTTFDELIYDDCTPCLVLFTRKTCHVCQAVKPKLAELEAEFGERFGFFSVDVEDEEKLFQRFSLKGVPQVMFFKDGEFVSKMAGEKDLDTYADEIERILE